MAVRQLGGITYGVGRNSELPFGVKLAGRFAGDNHITAQLAEERVPEGQILIHIQHQRYTDGGFGFIIFSLGYFYQLPQLFVDIFIDIGQVIFLAANAHLALVAADKPPPVGEDVDGKRAVVGAATAGHRLGLVLKISNLGTA